MTIEEAQEIINAMWWHHCKRCNAPQNCEQCRQRQAVALLLNQLEK